MVFTDSIQGDSLEKIAVGEQKVDWIPAYRYYFKNSPLYNRRWFVENRNRRNDLLPDPKQCFNNHVKDKVHQNPTVVYHSGLLLKISECSVKTFFHFILKNLKWIPPIKARCRAKLLASNSTTVSLNPISKHETQNQLLS